MIKSFLAKLAAFKSSAVPEPWVHGVHLGIGFLASFGLSIWLPLWAAASIWLFVAGLIEFYFDKHYEDQSFKDNLHDFEDYLIGVLLMLVVRLMA